MATLLCGSAPDAARRYPRTAPLQFLDFLAHIGLDRAWEHVRQVGNFGASWYFRSNGRHEVDLRALAGAFLLHMRGCGYWSEGKTEVHFARLRTLDLDNEHPSRNDNCCRLRDPPLPRQFLTANQAEKRHGVGA